MVLESKFKQIMITKWNKSIKITITQRCLEILGLLLYYNLNTILIYF